MTNNRILLDSALNQFQSARKYTLALIEGLEPDQWFWMPKPPVSNVAWQIGHLAVAQYGLMLFRQRGRQTEDAELLSSELRKLFSKGSSPPADSKSYPRFDEILALLHRVNDQVMRETNSFNPESMDELTEPPHAGPLTRMGSILFAAHHEMLHCGQIGMLRRMMGLSPLR